MKSICIIPARSGSVRIKNKNIIKFQNKPIIYWSIQMAKKSKCFKKIYVSTDSKLIADISKRSGNINIINRPKKLSKNTTPLVEVLHHAIKKINLEYEYVCCILPASPLIIHKDIINSKKLLSKSCSFVIPITKYDYPHEKSISIKNKNYISLTSSKTIFKRSQELPEKYHDAGQFYWGKKNEFLKFKNIFKSKKVKGYILPNYRVRDIDTYDDIKISNLIFKYIKK